ncbi:MAG: hypothetical protein HY308_11390 [Gammaproteobacteria bacterium]|nr:hypothetical protein [Gammaproteobacteria bacterium]
MTWVKRGIAEKPLHESGWNETQLLMQIKPWSTAVVYGSTEAVVASR